MIGQVPPDLDDQGKPALSMAPPPDIPPDIPAAIPLTQAPPDIPPDIPAMEQPSMWESLYQKATTPLTTKVSDTVDPYIDKFFGTSDDIHPNAKFGRGALKLITGAVDQLSSPIDLALGAATLGGSMALKSGLSGVSKALGTARKAISAPVIGHGATNVLSPDSTMQERGIGLLEAAGGVAGSGLMSNKGKLGQVANEVVAPSSAPPNIEMPAAPVSTGPKVGQSVRLKTPTIESIAKARREGWELDPKNPLTSDGKANLIYTGNKMDEVLESDVAGARPGKDANAIDPPVKDETLSNTLNLPRTIMASNDMSAPLRQGIGLIHKKEFWKSLGPMVKSWADEDYFNALQDGIAKKPLFMARQEPVLMKGKPVIDSKTGKPKMKTIPSFAEEAGIKLTDIGDDISMREESMMSKYADMVPGVKRSNRAYVGFLNKLRADTFETLMKSNNIINPYDKNNAPLAKEVAQFINNATGRGSLDFGKVNLEKQATALNSVFFSPRLIASRLQMMNPANYLSGNPAVRKEYLKSILAIGTAGNTVLALGSQIPGAEVEWDPRSKDFAKLKFENGIRIDPWAGFQQYLTQSARQIPNLKYMGDQMGIKGLPDIGGRAKASKSGEIYTMGKFGTNSRLDEALRFGEQKLNPVFTLVTRGMAGEDFNGDKYNLPEQVIQRFIPIFLADLKQLATEDPNLLPFPENYLDEFHPENLPYAIPAFFGQGMQQYQNK